MPHTRWNGHPESGENAQQDHHQTDQNPVRVWTPKAHEGILCNELGNRKSNHCVRACSTHVEGDT